MVSTRQSSTVDQYRYNELQVYNWWCDGVTTLADDGCELCLPLFPSLLSLSKQVYVLPLREVIGQTKTRRRATVQRHMMAWSKQGRLWCIEGCGKFQSPRLRQSSARSAAVFWCCLIVWDAVEVRQKRERQADKARCLSSSGWISDIRKFVRTTATEVIANVDKWHWSVLEKSWSNSNNDIFSSILVYVSRWRETERGFTFTFTETIISGSTAVGPITKIFKWKHIYFQKTNWIWKRTITIDQINSKVRSRTRNCFGAS